MGDLVIGTHSGADEPDGPRDRSVESVADDTRDHAGPAGSGEESPRAGGATAQGKAAGQKKKQRSFWKELPILVVIALALALLIKTFLVQAFSIPSGSMENTLQIGDRVLVDKLTPAFGAKPSRGEVAVFHDPGGWLDDEPTGQASSNTLVRWMQDGLSWVGLMPSPSEKDLIKRVIAVGGDTVSCSGTGPVLVNGKALTEPYIYPGATPCGDKPFGPIKVPANSVWVMGDHRNDSLDSRYHQDQPLGGAVPDKDVVGRAIVVAWPISHWQTLPIPGTFGQSGITNQALGAAGSPAALGLAGALPLTWAQRRLRRRRAARRG